MEITKNLIVTVYEGIWENDKKNGQFNCYMSDGSKCSLQIQDR